MQKVRRVAALLGIAVCLGANQADAESLAESRTAATPASSFRFIVDDFWLNLHQFLYVLGRVENKSTDSSRVAVKDAPMDEARGLSVATPAERDTWHKAIAFYAAGPSRRDVVFDASLVAAAQALARAGSARSLTGTDLDADLNNALTSVADIYRRLFWPSHRAANEAWVKDLTPRLEKHGPAILAFITRAYDAPWPKDGYVAHVTAYTNWAGAFSTDGGLLLLASLDPGLRGSQALEVSFHEAMHQWDQRVFAELERASKAQGVPFNNRLAHAMIFYTAGEATRQAVEGHVPYAEGGVWARGMEPLRKALAAEWQPWLDGKVTRDAALKALVLKAAETR
ncbi:MAG: hypothetical protein ABI672_11760 [Vicinamibacteria bacterium]